ncbi:hypothetical protein PPL_02446 [Heterostelium album PN500]|uniref:Uncharacterized protein n=1 Tax=Heterostelium pallidum (strain ATCC 26659 / Pp 5 / PN500) TaxID=670386 RepID=D3B239_HETP5|nr:hypothetical protein PPL_02446 [Heterostelium album PN500]EFA84414.1 hypothetical protein PPL_02446 [Heterostelium album PN500]|eukprot:XP_020436528.1 hypothetical protein PPL_02446 [Heterostelium album PN500]
MQFQALRLFERASKRVPLIRFPNRKAGETHISYEQPKVASTASVPPQAQPPKKKGNHVYITADQAPKRLPMKDDEIDMIMLGGIKEVAPPPKKSKK